MPTEGVHANVKAIQDMEAACARFARVIAERLPEIERELQQVTEALDERRADLRTEIADLEERISSADEDEDVSWERQRADDAQDELASVSRRIRRLEEVGNSYTRQARDAENLATTHAVGMRELLTGAVDDLKAYLALNSSTSLQALSAITNRGDTTGFEKPSEFNNDKVSITKIIDVLRSEPRLTQARWAKLGYESRIRVIRDIEGRIAPIQGREPASIGIHFESKRADERYTFGWYDRKENTIMIGYLLFEFNDPHEALSTFIHEGRHAYQWKCVNENDIHSRHAEAEKWKEEFEDYIRPEESYELYHNQAIECDARDYTRRVIEGSQ